MDDTVDEAIAVEDGDSAVVDGIFDDEVLERGELAVVRAPYYDDGDSVVPANLSGGEYVACFLPATSTTSSFSAAGDDEATSGTSPMFGTSSTLGTSSALKPKATLKSMTSGGDGSDRRPLCMDGSVEEYEAYLQRLHTGLVYVFREESQRLPTDGDEGERQGKLLQELTREIWALEDELEKVGKTLKHRAQLKNLSVAAEEGALVLQTYTVPLEEVRANLSEWRSALLSEYNCLTVLTNLESRDW